jgi:hypothetical protein
MQEEPDQEESAPDTKEELLAKITILREHNIQTPGYDPSKSPDTYSLEKLDRIYQKAIDRYKKMRSDNREKNLLGLELLNYYGDILDGACESFGCNRDDYDELSIGNLRKLRNKCIALSKDK